MTSRSCLPLFVFLTLSSIASIALAENWPQWRGPRNDGSSSEKGIATKWSQEENVLWRAPMPGHGGATPIVWNERLFVTSADDADLCLICLSTKDGKQLWRQTVTSGDWITRPGEGNMASPSPSTDGKHVWVFFSTGVLACYTVDGQEVWKFNVEDRYGTIDIQFGMSSTPVLHKDHLYLQLIHGAMKRDDDTRTGKVIKLDKLTGKEVWAVDRVTNAFFECKHSYASPCVYDDGKYRFMVAHGADCTTGHSLDTGEEIWRMSGLNGPSQLNKQNSPTFRFVASPSVVPGSIIIPTAKEGPTVVLRINEALKGDVTEKAEVLRWSAPQTPDVSIPLVVDGYVYNLHKEGKLQCLELETGKEMYFERTHGSVPHRSSPFYADGHIYVCAKDGRCTVVKAGPVLEIVATNELVDPIEASPIVANGVLYLRTYKDVYAIK